MNDGPARLRLVRSIQFACHTSGIKGGAVPRESSDLQAIVKVIHSRLG